MTDKTKSHIITFTLQYTSEILCFTVKIDHDRTLMVFRGRQIIHACVHIQLCSFRYDICWNVFRQRDYNYYKESFIADMHIGVATSDYNQCSLMVNFNSFITLLESEYFNLGLCVCLSCLHFRCLLRRSKQTCLLQSFVISQALCSW